MSSKAKFQAIRGTRDLLPPDTALWNRVEQTAHEVFTTFGFGEIRPPIFEPTELFSRAVGGDTDIVSKEMYSFFEGRAMGFPEAFLELPKLIDAARQRGEISDSEENLRQITKVRLAHERLISHLQSNRTEENFLNEFAKIIGQIDRELARIGTEVSLRPEATASVCRAYIEHNMQQMPQPVKLYYMGPMFRRERPQKGRYRQFYQIGAEILGGSDAPAIDAELIEMLMTFFGKCGLQGTELSINSIGHSRDNCRRGYVALLRTE